MLFCDEVTSGLDAANARRVVLALRGLARTGCTVVCTLHQPSSVVFALTDRLLLLQRGRAVYFGPTLASLAHFAALGLACPTFLNPADHLLDLVEDASGDCDDGNSNGDRDFKDGEDSDEQRRREADAMREIQERLNATAAASSSSVSVNRPAPALPHAIPSAAVEAGGADLRVTIASISSPTSAASASAASDTLASHRTQIGDLAAAFDVSAARAALTADMVCLAPALPVTSGDGHCGNAEKRPFAAPSEFEATAHLVASSSNASSTEGSTSITAAVSEAERVRVLTHRAWLATVRDPAIMYFRTGAACGIAALIGIIFFQTKTSVVRALLFLMCVFSLFCLPAITRYTEDRLIYSRGTRA